MSESLPEPSTTLAASDATGGGTIKKVALALVVVGGILCAAALLDEEARTRFGFAYLLGFVFCWGTVLGSLFFVALQHATRSVWSVVLRRPAEMITSPVIILAVLFVPIILFAIFHDDFHLFRWLKPEGDHLLEMKAPYLNRDFFIIRTVFFFLVWIGSAVFFLRGSTKQDGQPAGTTNSERMQAVAGPILILFAFTLTFASFDWMMSLKPTWFSTMYGVYIFSGAALSGLAAITLAVMGLRSTGKIPKDLIKRDHLYSLGALLFAFTCFWAYISFSQFMLIWYANMPEETIYYVDRIKDGWLGVSWLVVLLRFGLPFFLLLSRDGKMRPRRLVQVSVLILVGQLVDLYWLIMPQVPGQTGPAVSWADFGPTLLLVGILLLFMAHFLRRHGAVATGDPLLEESKNFHL
jgi:hypothetical protein